MTRYLILLTLFGCCLLPSCRNRLKVDEAIDATMRREVDSLNTIVLRALFDGRTEVILKLSVDEIRKSDSDRVQLRRLAKALRGLPFRTFEVEHQLFSNKLRPDTTSSMVFREGTEQEYRFRFYQPGRATLATFGRIPIDSREYGFTTSFSRRSGQWELLSLEIGLLRMQNLNAVDWFYKAEQQLDAHDFVDALVQNTIAISTMRPAGWTIQYHMEPRILAQAQELKRTTATNMEFPLSLDAVDKVAPRVMNVGMDCNDSGCVPMFILFTRTPLSDTAGLSRDASAFAADLDKWFAGVSQRNKTIAVCLVNSDYYSESDPSTFKTLRIPTVADWRY